MTEAAHLHDNERALALFAQGIGGAFFHIKSEGEFTGGAGHRAGRPLHDRGVLYLPERIERFSEVAHNRALYRLIALHQICHLEFGAYHFDIAEARSRCAPLAAQPLPESGLPESDFDTLYRHFPAPWLARHLFRLLEGTRIDARMLHCYPGIRRHYERIAQLERPERRPLAVVTDLPALTEALLRWSLGEAADTLVAQDATGALAPLIAQAEMVRAPTAEVKTSAETLARCYAVLDSLGLAPSAAGPGTGIEAVDEDTTAPFDVEPVSFRGDPPAEWLQREERLGDWREQQADMEEGQMADLAGAAAADSADAQQLSDEEADAAGTRPSAADVRKHQTERDTLARRISIEESRIAQALGRGEAHRGPSFLYDEWDSTRGTYLRGWCRVYEERALDSADDQIQAMLNRVAPHQAGVRRRFEQLKPFAYQRIHRIIDGEDLDFDQLVDYQTERKRGECPDDRVYTRRDRLHRDVATAFLVDLSASTDDPIEPPEAEAASADLAPDPRSLNLRDPFDDTAPAPAGHAVAKDAVAADPGSGAATGSDEDAPPRRVIDVQRESLVLMAQALETLHDPYAIYGFSGYGRDNVEFYVAKDFRDPFSYRTLGALAAMKPRRSTRMGPAIRHSIRRLKHAASALKVMIVISDGFPQDCDYGPDRSDHGYGVEDTAKALVEAQDAGIGTFCVTVDRSGHDYLKRMCPDARYMVIEDIEALPDALSKVYERLTGR